MIVLVVCMLGYDRFLHVSSLGNYSRIAIGYSLAFPKIPQIISYVVGVVVVVVVVLVFVVVVVVVVVVIV